MRAKQYEVWIADLNPKIGTEPGKIRPVIIVQTDMLNRHHPSSIICPITTNVNPDSTILRVHLENGSCGLSEECDIMIDQIRAIDNARLIKKVGSASVDVQDKIKDNLKIILVLD